MKNVSRVLTSAALAATFSLAAYAQTPTTTATPATTAATPSPQEIQAKADLYKKFLDNRKGTPEQQKVAYEAGKEYLGKYGNATEKADLDINTYIQNWIGKYETAVADFGAKKATSDVIAAASSKQYAKAFELGRPLVEKQPNDFNLLLTLAQAGYYNASTPKTSVKSLYHDAVRYTRSTIQLVESGKVTDYSPFKSKDELLGFLNLGLGLNLIDSAPNEAVAALVKVAQSNSSYKTLPATHYNLANLYYKEYKKLADDYKRLYEGKDKTPESEVAYQRLNQVLDRVIDAYGRTLALSTQTDPATVAFKKGFMTDFTALYKGRHDNSEAGMTEYLAAVLAKPLPDPSTEVVPTPTPIGATTPATGTPPATDGTKTTPKSTTTTQPVNTAKPMTTTPPATVKPAPKPGTPPATPKQVSKNTGTGSKSAVVKRRSN
ncbi:MAG: hypothetical protein WKH64_17420 [Chloroflexia bacterium]